MAEDSGIVRSLVGVVNRAGTGEPVGEEVKKLLAPGFRLHLPGVPNLALEGAEEFARAFVLAFPGFENTLEDEFGDAEKVAARLRFSGTHSADFLGIPATGNEAVVPYVLIAHLSEGTIAELWVQFDGRVVLDQLAAGVPTDSDRRPVTEPR